MDLSAQPEENFRPYLDGYLPIETVEEIFSYISPEDLFNLAQTCCRFKEIIDEDVRLWRKIYVRTYGTNQMLYNPFRFRRTDKFDYPGPPNSWRECCIQLSNALHVRHIRPDEKPHRWHYDNIKEALEAAKELVQCDKAPFTKPHNSQTRKAVQILLHPGTYLLKEALEIDGDFALIGLTNGARVSNVEITGTGTEGMVHFVAGAWRAYIGHVKLLYAPHIRESTRPCLTVQGMAGPMIEFCRVESTTTAGAAVKVSGLHAKPMIRHCNIVESFNGLQICNHASGTYFNNTFDHHRSNGIIVCYGAKPHISQCNIKRCHKCGIFLHTEARGVIAMCLIRCNAYAAIKIQYGANPLVHHNVLYDNATGVRIDQGGHGTIRANSIFHSQRAGVIVAGTGSPLVQLNRVCLSPRGIGVLLVHSETGRIDCNDIYANLYGLMVDNSGGMVERNAIHGNLEMGVYLATETHLFHTAMPTIIVSNVIKHNVNVGLRIAHGAPRSVRMYNRIEMNRMHNVQEDVRMPPDNLPDAEGPEEVAIRVARNPLIDGEEEPQQEQVVQNHVGEHEVDDVGELFDGLLFDMVAAGDGDDGGDNDDDDSDTEEDRRRLRRALSHIQDYRALVAAEGPVMAWIRTFVESIASAAIWLAERVVGMFSSIGLSVRLWFSRF